MQNRLLIAATCFALIAAIGGLLVTISQALGSEDAAVAQPTQAFVPQQLEVGQKTKDEPPSQAESDDEADDEVEIDPPKIDPPKVKPPPRAKSKKRVKYKPAVLQIVTNFDQADVTVNGLPYPEYYEPGEPEGMVLPAGGPYNVEVKFGSSTKVYNLHLRPHETRLLLVELSGYNKGAPAPKPAAKKPEKKEKKEEKKKEEKKDDDGEGGKITVYSKPAGTVIVDGSEKDTKTPGTIDLDLGRHEVQVKYETGTISEKKIVRVRKGSRIKLFFRERKNASKD